MHLSDKYDGVIRMLDVLLSSETSEAEKRKILQDDYDIQMTQTMETLGLTVEQAMAALKVPENERQKYKDLLERQ